MSQLRAHLPPERRRRVVASDLGRGLGISVIGTNKRYGFRLDEQTVKRMQQQEPPPATLPPAAWGKQPIEWTQARPAVWVWVSWSGRPAERRRAYVKGHNDRVCIVNVDGDGGGWEIVVWRNAVTIRQDRDTPGPRAV